MKTRHRKRRLYKSFQFRTLAFALVSSFYESDFAHDRANRILRASNYLSSTREEFAQKVSAANNRIQTCSTVIGALAGHLSK